MPKILYIVHNAMDVGGVQKVLAAKASFWAAQGNDVMVLVTNAEGALYFDYHENVQFEIKSLKNRGLSYFFAYKKAIEQTVCFFKPTHIFVLDNGLKGLLVPYFNLQKAICIYERHGEILVEQKSKPATFWQSIYNLFLKKTYSTLAQAFDAIVVLNEPSQKEWKHPKLFVIPNLISFHSHQKSTLDSKIILFVARYQPEKGFDYLFEIWKQLSDEIHDWKLHIYTDQPQKVKEISTQLGSFPHENFEIFGVESIPEQMYLKSSLLISTSKSEGFSLVLAEAMSFGIPCVAFDCDFGPRGIIQNGENGFLIPTFDTKMFVEKVQLLSENSQLRTQMGLKALVSSERFQPENIMKLWQNLILEMAK